MATTKVNARDTAADVATQAELDAVAAAKWNKEIEYKLDTADVVVTATAQASGQDCSVSAGFTAEAVPYEIEFFSHRVVTGNGALVLDLWENVTWLMRLGLYAGGQFPVLIKTRVTPAAGTRTYKVKTWCTDTTGGPQVYGNEGGNSRALRYLRITKV